MSIFKSVASLFLLVSACLAESVITLDGNNFDAGIQEHKLILVEFYAPWCGHCQHLAPEYEKAASELAASHPNVKLAKVDADNELNRPLAERFGVRGFPTLKVFRDGQPTDYQGGRTADAIASYMRKQAAPAVSVLESVEAARAFSASDKVVIVGYFAAGLSGAAYEAFAEAASRLRNEYVFGAAAALDAASLESVAGPTAAGSADIVVVYKKFDDGRAVLSTVSDTDAIVQFINAEAVPLLAEIGPDNYMKYAERQLPLAYLFVDLTQANHVTDYVPLVRPAAEATKGRVQWVYIDASKYGRHAERLALSGNVLPSLALEVQSTGKHYAFDEAATITADAVLAWINSFLDGSLLPTIKSEPIPEDNSGPVKTVVANNFDSLVLDPTTDVFVEFYAPWCGHCKKLAPIWDELGSALASSNVVIAKCDATANDIDAKYEIRGFPTIKWFPAGADKTPVDYNGDRSLESLVEFVRSHATSPVQIDQASVEQAAAAAGANSQHDEL
eukprot:TRINITY_DN1161_c3_g1_i1.p1 TRINITY_DN1161_c3_g1~~TRINITY_DN1161_c3_g1_i1.p1  ORF type:complete len:503 (-),score=207.93 TRINITY_DN1161_c3_g1_i1:340-1848(-)